MKYLLSQQGDVTVPHLTGAQPPAPTPPPAGGAGFTFATAEDRQTAMTWASENHLFYKKVSAAIRNGAPQ
jgi:hypothetical protein